MVGFLCNVKQHKVIQFLNFRLMPQMNRKFLLNVSKMLVLKLIEKLLQLL